MQEQSTYNIPSLTLKSKKRIFEFINATLLTGDVPGLFTKEEMMAKPQTFQVTFKSISREDATPTRLRQYFIEIVRDRLHMVLCMSLANAKFPKRAVNFQE